MAGTAPQFASLYVGDLHPDVTEAMLYEIFNSVGPVGSIRVCRDSATRRSLGYGYVNFHAVSDAERALDTLNYSSIKGRACRIMWSQRDPSLRKSGVGNIHVRNLDRSIDNKALYDTFSLFGNILSCKVAAQPDGKSLGHGFVHYETEEAAKQAIERVNGMQIGDKTVIVAPFLKQNERDSPVTVYTNLYIKNFPQDWDEEKIKETFGAYGEITSSCVTTDAKGRKFAFVNFGGSEAALKCVEEMHDKDLRSEEEKKAAEESEEKEEDIIGKLYVQRAITKAERARQLKVTSQEKAKPSQGVNLYVKNLDESTDDDALKAMFESFGSISSVRSMTDEKGNCKGFGFVSFASPDEATKAVTEMHLKVVKGKPLYVGLAEKRDVRAERLRNRYTAPVKGKGGSKGMGPQMMGQQMSMGMGMGMGGPPMSMMGKGGPQMMGKGGPMMGGGMGKGPMPQMGQMGAPPMMGMMGGPQMNPQMMQMMQQKGGPQMNPQMMQMKGNPQMMAMMGKGGMPGMMPGGPMPGMMRPMMPQMPGQRPMGAAPLQPQALQPNPNQPLNASQLANAPPNVQKQMIGEKLYPMIARHQPELAGKVVGMMLEMDNSELLMLLESDAQLKVKLDEALQVLGAK
jgi:polyadenylate-binding protein